VSTLSGSRASILVLEDDPGIRRLQLRQLERDGYHARGAGTTDEARALLAESPADLLVIDYQLGAGENGLEFYRSLQAAGASIPAVLVTGFSDEARLLEAMRSGVREFLPKTPNFVELLSPTVEHVLERAGQERRLVEVEAAGRAKDEFLATLSHELRTPLTPVLALLPALQSDPRLPEDVREDLATIGRNISLEARLIDDLLDLTRIGKGKIDLDYTAVDLIEILNHTVKSVCGLDASSKDLQVVEELASGSHVLNGDSARLTQVLWNLLKNATKFTPAGGRIVIRTRHETVNGEPWLVLEVEDTGIGIEPEALPRIFATFEQGGRAITRQFGGLGLGLAISQAIVKLHHGTITAESEGRDRGARFTVRLPVARASVKPRSTLPQPSDDLLPGVDRSAHLLLVEDHADTARILARLLRRAGFHVTPVNTVAAAVEAVETARTEAGPNGQPLQINLILSDLGLPDGTGVDLMKRISPGIPAIALSGFGMEEDVARALDAGFDRHFTKPVEFSKLLLSIRELLSQQPATNAA
jgi:signal transduction histidine kinase